MNIQINLNKKQIAQIVQDWFSSSDLNKRHFWERDEIAKVIKMNLQANNQWYRKRRGPNKKKLNQNLTQITPNNPKAKEMDF
jgi:hypothetical protein